MARTPIDDILVQALGQKRSEVKAQIDALSASTLQDLTQQLADLEAKLQSIDPTIQPVSAQQQAILELKI